MYRKKYIVVQKAKIEITEYLNYDFFYGAEIINSGSISN